MTRNQWQSVSLRGRVWTIEQLIARWPGEWNRRIPRFVVDKPTALGRIRSAVERGEHRSSNGEIPARILDLLDSLAIRQGL